MVSISRRAAVVVAVLSLCGGAALAQAPGFVGSYELGDGPGWDDDGGAVPLSCLQACAEVFGGSAANYACSTELETIDNLAWLDGWGDTQYCHPETGVPQPEGFVFGTNADCGEEGCYYSAYIRDHQACFEQTNYCFAVAPASVLEIPTLNLAGLVLMAALLSAFAVPLLRRR
ncbi:MAG TPA: IPTL-CTERM sorting domain-containing protein [Thermoanaerobaculia bacterium]|nr:IPTL-CTERM sorting domain-containing protein [Thermoanaerobaculia bacterium]